VESRKSNKRSQERPQIDTAGHNDAPVHHHRFSHARRLLFTKKTAITLAVLVVIVISGLLIRHFFSGNAPTYRTVLPDGKSADELGGWQRISPPEKDPVFAYNDTINGIPITVSQQPLPDSFKTDTASHVAELAKSYNATVNITAGDTTVYIGTSVKGPQSVILTKKNLLVLIKSQKTIDNAAWEDYIKSLDNSGASRIPKY
jgi:hypothetical protein